MPREIQFKMERPNLVEIGQRVPVRESVLPNTVYYYVIEPAVAMSGNFPSYERLKRADYSAPIFGTVTNIEHTPRGFYVTASFEDI